MGLSTAEDIKQKAEKAKKWETENPGLSWCSPLYAEDAPKIFISKEMLESKAYRSLSKIAMLLLQDFLAKREMVRIKRSKEKKWACRNNGEIIYTYTEAVSKGISRKQFVNGIDELQEKGFVDITHRGRGGRKPAKGTGDVTTFWIDDRWKKYGTADFKTARIPRKKDTRKGRGFRLIWQNRERGEAMIRKGQKTKERKNIGI